MQPRLTQVWVLPGALAVLEAVAVEDTPVVRVPVPVAEVEPPKMPDKSELTTDVAVAMIPVPVAVAVPVVTVVVVFGFGTVAAKIVAL